MPSIPHDASENGVTADGPWVLPASRPVRAQAVDGAVRIQNRAETPNYVIAHAADPKFSLRPAETAFEPAARRFTVTVPARAVAGGFRISVLECSGDARRSHTGARNAQTMQVEIDPTTDAAVLTVRLDPGADVVLSRPQVQILDLEPDLFEPHGAEEQVPGLDRSEVKTLLAGNLPRVRSKELSSRVEAFIEDGQLAVKGYPTLEFRGEETWRSARTRAHQRVMHGFLFLPEWAGDMVIDQFDAERLKGAFGEVLSAWLDGYGSSRPADAPMSWHDETTAQRVLNVLSFVESCRWDLPDGVDQLVRDVLEPAAALLFAQDFHETGNNHGMFQDLALLHYAALTPYPTEAQRHRMAARAISRLDDYFSASFTAEGVHVENSPSYHLMASHYLKQFAELLEKMNHPRAHRFHGMVDHAGEYATHSVMPNGVHPPISDTKQRQLGSTVHGRLFEAPAYRFAVTAGAEGQEPTKRTLVLPGSGYAMHRSSWGDPLATFVFFSAAYNADYHKHSDDLSIHLRSRGHDLLCESGPYGYDYQHPFSRYAYSQFSHNSLVVDGMSLPRTDGQFDAVTLKENQTDGSALDVTGINTRYDDVTHSRRLQIRELSDGMQILVTDTIESASQHNYEILWNLGPGIKSMVSPNGFSLRAKGVGLASATITSPSPWAIKRFEGAESPAPRGWRFPDFGKSAPAQQLSVRFSGTDVIVQTQFDLPD